MSKKNIVVAKGNLIVVLLSTLFCLQVILYYIFEKSKGSTASNGHLVMILYIILFTVIMSILYFNMQLFYSIGEEISLFGIKTGLGSISIIREMEKKDAEIKSKERALKKIKQLHESVLNDLSYALENYQKSSDKYKRIVDNISDALFIHDFDGKIISANKVAQRLFRYSEEEFVGKNISEFQKNCEEKGIPESWKKLDNVTTASFECDFKRKRSKKIPVSVNSKLVSKSGNGIVQSFVRDISNIRKSEEKIKEFNKELEKKIKNRTQDLVEANEEIKDLLEVKTKFLNQVAHDLRTPLTPIKGLLPIIGRGIKDKEKTKMFRMIEDNVSYLSELLNDTLNISRIDSGTVQFDFKPVDIAEIVDSVLEKNQYTFKKEKVKIVNKVPKNSVVIGDDLRLTEVLQNLIGNSLKFMPKKKLLEFTLKPGKQYLTLIIKDTGVGIKKTELGKIFDEFYKIDESRHEHSSGLGLAICKRIIRAHKGTIWAESQGVGRGSSFHIKLNKYGEKNDKNISSR